MTIALGNTARHLRESLGLTQRAAAEQLEISFVHLCNIEKNRAVPSPSLIDRFRTVFGIDLYVLAWCLHGDNEKLPKSMQKAAAELARGWQKQMAELIATQRQRADA